MKMAALTADLELEMRGAGKIRSFDVTANDTIYKGSLVSIDTDGFALPSTDTAAYRFVGIAVEQADNTGGSDGDIEVKVYTEGCFKLTGVSLAQANVGTILYVNDDNSVEDGTGAAQDCAVGMLVKYISATSGWVEINHRALGVVSA